MPTELKQADLGSLQSNQYYIVKDDITLPSMGFSFPANCVFEFLGGSFSIDVSDNPVTVTDIEKDQDGKTVYGVRYFGVDFNNSVILSAPCCIFHITEKDQDFNFWNDKGEIVKTVIISKKVSFPNLANDEVKAEWFNDGTHGGSEQVYINQAIGAAHGCPVILGHRTYTLSAPIVFPFISRKTNGDKALRQTLVSPGTLVVAGDDAAIDIKTHNVWLKINRIEGRNYHGTGVRYSENCYHGVAEVGEMISLERGFDVSPVPVWNGQYDDEGNKVKFAGVQYIKFIFQSIRAKYGFYVFVREGAWFTESYILGGVLSGENGIYFSSGTTEIESANPKQAVNGVVFNNIAFEGISSLPIRSFNIQECNFHNLRMSTGLPGLGDDWDISKKWVYMDNVEMVEMDFKSLVRPNRFEAVNKCRCNYVKGFIVDDEGWYINHFDRLLISSLKKNVRPLPPEEEDADYVTHMTATSSMQPFNMCKNLVVTGGSDMDDEWYEKEFTLKDILPILKYPENDLGEIKVLPSTLNVEVTDNNRLILDISGITRFAPCALINIFANVTPGGELVIKSTSLPSKILSCPGISVTNNSATINEVGLYRLTWNSQWELVLSKITN